MAPHPSIDLRELTRAQWRKGGQPSPVGPCNIFSAPQSHDLIAGVFTHSVFFVVRVIFLFKTYCTACRQGSISRERRQPPPGGGGFILKISIQNFISYLGLKFFLIVPTRGRSKFPRMQSYAITPQKLNRFQRSHYLCPLCCCPPQRAVGLPVCLNLPHPLKLAH